MKVLVLNGSPKGESSNTMRLTRAFCAGLQEAMPADVETISVCKLDIKDCLGCFNCWSKTPGECCIKDDMAQIITKILEAQMIVWSFPLYYFAIPSRLKALIDRQLPLCLPFMTDCGESGGHPGRYDLSGQRHVVISTCGFYTSKGNYEAVDAQMERMYGEKGYTAIYCGEGELFRIPELRKRTDEYLDYVRMAGREYAKGGISAATRSRLDELLFPRDVYEQMADASWNISKEHGRQSEPADDSLSFTRQMAALYNTASWKGKDQVLEMCYTDTGKTYQIRMQQDGYSVQTEDFLPYTTRIETPLTVWKQIAAGEIRGDQAMMERLYTVKGDFDLMLHWDDYFGYPASPPAENPAEARMTNMTLLLLPWVVIWVLLSIHPRMGAMAGLLVTAVLPFAFLKWRATCFEYITNFTVAVICIGVLLGGPTLVLIPLSYLLFGLMWLISAFQKIPLTAYYSMKDYGGEAAWENAIFIRTNRILTACWGVLYLVTPVWTYFLLQSPVGPLCGAINSLLPALMGLFTTWFQKWHPKHYAAG